MLFQTHRLIVQATFLFLMGLLSCSPTAEFDQVLTSKPEKKDFLDELTVSGTLEAVNTKSFACPGVRADVTVVYLIPEGTYAHNGDTLCILEGREIENDYLQALIDLENAQAEYNKSRADLELQFLILEAQVKTIEASSEIKELDSVQMRFTSASDKKITELELEKAEIERNVALKKLEFLKKINEKELQKMKLKIDQQQNKVDQAKYKLDQLTITSDIEGIVIYEQLWSTGKKVKEGDVVWWIMPIIQIPDLNAFQIKMNVSESVYKRIQKEQSIEVTVDAFPDIRLTGKIKYKAPVGKPVKEQSEVKMFEVTASLDSSRLDLQPGLGVTCQVLVKNIPDTIVVPLISLFDEDSAKVVYVAGNGRFFRKTVKVSDQNNLEAVIVSGLEGHEVLALSKPPESLISQ